MPRTRDDRTRRPKIRKAGSSRPWPRPSRQRCKRPTYAGRERGGARGGTELELELELEQHGRINRPRRCSPDVPQAHFEAKLDALQAELNEANDALHRAENERQTAEDKLVQKSRDHASEVGALESQLRSAQESFLLLQQEAEHLREQLDELQAVRSQNQQLRDEIDELEARSSALGGWGGRRRPGRGVWSACGVAYGRAPR